MGIRDLNRYISDHCSKHAISRKPLLVLRNKTIVIDTSIYLYKYATHDTLETGFRAMLKLFQTYNITPIFIFDGKAPVEKHELLKERSRMKKEAKREYDQIQETLNQVSLDELIVLEKRLEALKTQIIRIRPMDISAIKRMFDESHIQYEMAKGEADRLCASMVLDGTAWACMSDDMDMFVYGCPRILRHLSLHNQTILFYDLDQILKELDLSKKEFREIAVISGTDYHDKKNNMNVNVNLYETLKWFAEYKKQVVSKGLQNTDFYDWLVKHTKYITDLGSLQRIYSMFCFESSVIV
jgi:5'-3' exonuclease